MFLTSLSNTYISYEWYFTDGILNKHEKIIIQLNTIRNKPEITIIKVCFVFSPHKNMYFVDKIDSEGKCEILQVLMCSSYKIPHIKSILNVCKLDKVFTKTQRYLNA